MVARAAKEGHVRSEEALRFIVWMFMCAFFEKGIKRLLCVSFFFLGTIFCPPIASTLPLPLFSPLSPSLSVILCFACHQNGLPGAYEKQPAVVFAGLVRVASEVVTEPC